MKLPLIAQDKANHALYGGAIACMALLVALQLGLPVLHACLAAAALAAVAAVGKEVLDRVGGKGTPELRDAVFTAAGAALPIAPCLWLALGL